MAKLLPRSIRLFIPVFILLIAFALQLSYLAELRTTFPGSFIDQPFCGVDARAHQERALGIMSGQYPGQGPWSFIPFYPLFLATIYRWLGHNLYLPVLFQSILNLTTIAALYAIARKLFSRPVAVLASLALASYSAVLYYIPCFDQALLTLPLFTLAIFFLLKFQGRRRLVWLAAAGVMVGLSSLSRPTVLILLPAVTIWLFWYRSSLPRFILHAFCFGLMALVVLLPITWRNYQATGRLTVIKSDSGGVNLFTGNNPDASGLDSMAMSQSQPGVLRNIALQGRLKSGQTSYAAEVLKYIRTQPGDWLALTATKFWLWFGEADRLITSPFFPLAVSDSRLLRWLPFEWQAAVVTAILGLALVRGRQRQASVLIWLAYGLFSLATVVFFISLRFRLPFAPVILLYAMALAAQGKQWLAGAPNRFLIVLLILLLGYLVLPGLGIFALIFAGLALWPAFRRGGSATRRWAMIAVWSYLVVGAFWWQTRAAATDVSQDIAHYLGPRLTESGILGQTFQMDCAGLNRVTLELGTFDDRHDQPVIFALATDKSGQELLFTEQFEGREVYDRQWREFTFEPLPDSQGRSYFFFMASPTSTLDNSLTARGFADTPIDYYKGGEAYAGALGSLQSMQADFAFEATCRQSFWQELSAGVTKMAETRFWGVDQKNFYWAVLGLHLSLLLIALGRLLFNLVRADIFPLPLPGQSNPHKT